MTPRETLFTALAPVVEYLRGDTSLQEAGRSQDLADVVYRVCHGRQAIHAPGSRARRDERTRMAFVETLSQANGGVGFDYSGPPLFVEEDGRVMFEYGGINLWTNRSPVTTPAGHVVARFLKEMRNLYAGHYVAIGNADNGKTIGPLRVYWNIAADDAARLVDCVSRRFNDASVPFRLKLLDLPAAYTRADAAILYLPRTHLREGAALIADLYDDVAATLRVAVSAFAYRIAPGVSVAEDPPDGSSFGMQRSQQIASALSRGVRAPDPLAAVACALEAAGYDLDHFYRNPDSQQTYDDFVIDAG